MNKVRCANCKGYFDRSPDTRTRGITNYCSDECFMEAGMKPRKSKPKVDRINKMKARKPGNDIPQETREKVYARDSHRCQFCGATNVHLHHIVYKSHGVDHQVHNLIALCPEHHALVHSNKRVWFPVLRAWMWAHYVLAEPRRPVALFKKSLPQSWLRHQQPCTCPECTVLRRS